MKQGRLGRRFSRTAPKKLHRLHIYPGQLREHKSPSWTHKLIWSVLLITLLANNSVRRREEPNPERVFLLEYKQLTGGKGLCRPSLQASALFPPIPYCSLPFESSWTRKKKQDLAELSRRYTSTASSRRYHDSLHRLFVDKKINM